MRVLKIHKAELPRQTRWQRWPWVNYPSYDVECGQVGIPYERARTRWEKVTCLKCLWRRKGT